MSENENDELANLAIQDKAAFMSWPLGYSPVAHQELWCDAIQEHKDLVLLSPANHGKTTVFSVANPIHEIARNRNIRIGLVTSRENLAMDILSEIKWHLENNEELTNAFGRFKPERISKWSNWQIQVENGKHTLRKKDATITALGAMSSIKGVRFDLLLGDDIVDEKNSNTPEKRDALWDWLWGTLIPRCEPWAQRKFMGTVENEDDVYHRFMENNRGFKVIKQQAILDDLTQKVLWPEKMTYEYLTSLRGGNYVQFMKTYQNTCVGSEVAKISQAKIDACYDGSRVMHPSALPAEIRQRYKLILQLVDPAWTKKNWSKYAVITTLGLTHDDRREVLDIFREKLEYHDLFNWIKTKYYSLMPHLVIVESNQMQRRLAEEIGECGIPVKASHTGADKNDIDAGIPMIYSLISQGKLMLPCGDEPSKKLSHQLINEILQYPNGTYSDILMTLYFGEKEIRSRQLVAKALPGDNSHRRIIHSKFSRRHGLAR